MIRWLTGALLALTTIVSHSAEEFVDQRAAYFAVVERQEPIDARVHLLREARIDLTHPLVDIRAALVADTLLETRRFEDRIDLEDFWMAAGTDRFSDARGPYGGPIGFPNGPLAREGRWAISPGGVWSAVGFAPDNQPVFASTWLKDAREPWLRIEIRVERGAAVPIAAMNRYPAENALTLLTPEYASRVKTVDSNAMMALLSSDSSRPTAVEAALNGVDRDSAWLVYKTIRGPGDVSMGPREWLLYGQGEAAEWMADRLARNDRLELKFAAPPGWGRTREIIGLGAPLIWRGRIVSEDDLSPAVGEAWPSDDAPARTILAWDPRSANLRIVHPKALQERDPASRRAMAQRLIGEGAHIAFEFARREGPPTLFFGEEWIGQPPGDRLSPHAPGALLIGDSGPANENALLNLARLPGVRASAMSGNRMVAGAGAATDGRYGENPALDHFWEMDADLEADPPAATWHLELGARRSVRRIEILHAEAAGFSSHFNTRDFRLLGQASYSGRWIALNEWTDNEAARTYVDYPDGIELQSLKIEITKPNMFELNPKTRLAEVIVWGRR